MKWKKASEYAIVSACWSYSVARYGVEPFQYLAWRMPSHPLGRSILGAYPDASQAKKRAEDDHAQP